MQSIGLTIPIFLFILIATVQSVAMLVMGRLFGPSRNTAVKEMPYESGMDPIHDTRRRFDIRFHLVAIAFLVFDVEVLFMYPWPWLQNVPPWINRRAASIWPSNRA
ncbi:MAG: NADH-quinone oxidoreductase subunit A [Planctomycetes bacterium]|nr:NADH-quinone oxidoreductase subunit A [Planctomycetota bacterium]